MIVWVDNKGASPSDGYGYTQDMLWKYIGSSGLPITKTKQRVPKEIARLIRIPINIGYILYNQHIEDIVINHSMPEFFSNSLRYSVGFTYWETNRLPKDWVKNCNYMNEIWTCSAAMQDVFIDSGVTRPVYNFSLGVDPELYFPKKRTPHDQFTFLSVGSPAHRKNSQISVDAFLKVFGGNNNYKLIYKSNGPPIARIYGRGGGMGGLIHPQIQVIDNVVSHQELAEIYDLADCLLYPTMGEGWGLIPFQAIAKGIPTICTNALACSEFAGMSVPLDFKWSTEKQVGIHESGEWAAPNFDDLCDKMKYVVDNYKSVASKTFKSAQYINKNMTWEKVSRDYINRCWEILKEV